VIPFWSAWPRRSGRYAELSLTLVPGPIFRAGQNNIGIAWKALWH